MYLNEPKSDHQDKDHRTKLHMEAKMTREAHFRVTSDE